MRRSVTAVLVFVMVLVLAAPAHAAPVIRASGTRWSPASLTVDRGTVVRWKGVSGVHHLRAYGGNWSFERSLPAGSRVQRRFNRSGRYRFYCTIHATVSAGRCSGMCGKVVVRG